MSYLIRMEEPAESFLYDEERVSNRLLAVLNAFIRTHFEEGGDRYINDPEYQVAPESHTIVLDYVVQDPESKRLRRILFYVDTEFAVKGVLRLMYIDEE